MECHTIDMIIFEVIHNSHIPTKIPENMFIRLRRTTGPRGTAGNFIRCILMVPGRRLSEIF